MVITILLIVIIFIQSFVAMHYIFKSYSMGLKHNYELKHDIQPTEIVNSIKEFYHPKKEKEEELTPSIIDEWLNGAKES